MLPISSLIALYSLLKLVNISSSYLSNDSNDLLFIKLRILSSFAFWILINDDDSTKFCWELFDTSGSEILGVINGNWEEFLVIKLLKGLLFIVDADVDTDVYGI